MWEADNIEMKDSKLGLVIKLWKVYQNMFLLLDKATWNKNEFVISWLEKESIEYMFFPTRAFDLNLVEEWWRQTRNNVICISHNSKGELAESLENYWKSQPFRHSVFSYLSP